MGIENREYMGDTRPSFFASSSKPWAIKALLVANVAVFLLQRVFFDRFAADPASADPVTSFLSLSLSDLGGLEVWRLVTYGFCHGNAMHLLFNLFILWMFGRAVEPIYESKEFLAFFLGGVVVAGVCHVLLQAVAGVEAGVIGASGGVMAVVFLTAMHFPRAKVLLFFVIPIELRWLAVMYAAADVFGLAQAGSAVAHAAHLGGAAFGVAYKHFGWNILRATERLRPRRRRGPRLRLRRGGGAVGRPSAHDADDLESRLDEILAKIAEQGQESLTDKERQTLIEASRRYRQR